MTEETASTPEEAAPLTQDQLAFVTGQDALLHTRIGFFVAAEAVAGSVLSAGTPTDAKAAFWAAVFAVPLTLIWWVTSANISMRIRSVEDSMKADPFIAAWLEAGPGLPSSRVLLVHALPALFLVGWCLLIWRFW
jgi:hypothetical protein